MKKLMPKIVKSVVVTVILIAICYLILLIAGKLNEDTMKLVAGLNGMYSLPIILGNLLVIGHFKRSNLKGLFKQILKSITVSMFILFVVNFILWVIIWGAPFADLFTERNIIFYLIGFCILIVISIIYNSILYFLNAKHPA